MIVTCRANTGSDLGPFARGLYHSAQTRFDPLVIGKTYD